MKNNQSKQGGMSDTVSMAAYADGAAPSTPCMPSICQAK